MPTCRESRSSHDADLVLHFAGMGGTDIGGIGEIDTWLAGGLFGLGHLLI